MLILLSLNLYSYVRTCNENGIEDKHVSFKVNYNSFYDINITSNPNYWKDIIVELTKSAMNYWNEAGSEHSLEYGGYGTSNPYIRYENNGPSSLSATAYWVCDPVFDDSDVDDLYIIVNKGRWTADHFYSYELLNTLTHEFGHILSLDHTQDAYYQDISIYESILMKPNGFIKSRHLTEDDKYGVRAIYGKDDQNIEISRSDINDIGIPIDTYQIGYLLPLYYTTGNVDYQTYSKPQLTYQTNSYYGYDYIMTWIKSNTREVNYRFVSDCGTDKKDLCAVSGSLGNRHYIEDSETLTAPSIATNTLGSKAVIAWRQETSNLAQKYADDIMTASINVYSGTASVTSNGKVFSNNSCNNDDYSCFKAKTMSAPIVVWLPEWSRFLLFYTVMDNDDDNWKIAYVYSTDSNGTDWVTSDIKYLDLKSNWNPMGVQCNLKDSWGSSSGCLLVFNEIQTTPNTTKADHVAKISYKVLEPLNANPYNGLVVKDINKYLNVIGWYDRMNYGHISLSLRSEYDGDYSNIAVVNIVTKSEDVWLENLIITLKKDSLNNWNMGLSVQNQSGGALKSRTGFSVAWNAREKFYKYLNIWE
jgi:hypothetical protein